MHAGNRDELLIASSLCCFVCSGLLCRRQLPAKERASGQVFWVMDWFFNNSSHHIYQSTCPFDQRYAIFPYLWPMESGCSYWQPWQKPGCFQIFARVEEGESEQAERQFPIEVEALRSCGLVCSVTLSPPLPQSRKRFGSRSNRNRFQSRQGKRACQNSRSWWRDPFFLPFSLSRSLSLKAGSSLLWFATHFDAGNSLALAVAFPRNGEEGDPLFPPLATAAAATLYSWPPPQQGGRRPGFSFLLSFLFLITIFVSSRCSSLCRPLAEMRGRAAREMGRTVGKGVRL
jgi:hypothetical protein